jgi:hypothetical protein
VPADLQAFAPVEDRIESNHAALSDADPASRSELEAAVDVRPAPELQAHPPVQGVPEPACRELAYPEPDLQQRALASRLSGRLEALELAFDAERGGQPLDDLGCRAREQGRD